MTAYLAPVRNAYFRDIDGIMATSKRIEEVVSLVLDWSDLLASGETISSVAYEDLGVTRSSTSNTTTTTTTKVTGTGSTIVKATLSTGRVLHREVRFYGVDGRVPGDYRG